MNMTVLLELSIVLSQLLAAHISFFFLSRLGKGKVDSFPLLIAYKVFGYWYNLDRGPMIDLLRYTIWNDSSFTFFAFTLTIEPLNNKINVDCYYFKVFFPNVVATPELTRVRALVITAKALVKSV